MLFGLYARWSLSRWKRDWHDDGFYIWVSKLTHYRKVGGGAFSFLFNLDIISHPERVAFRRHSLTMTLYPKCTTTEEWGVPRFGTRSDQQKPSEGSVTKIAYQFGFGIYLK
jgi:hypothetical protein